MAFFDGLSDSLDLGDVFDQTGDYTIEAEINPSALQGIDGSVGGGMRILSKDTGSVPNGWALSIGDIDTPGRIRSFQRSATSSGVVDADGSVVIDVWQHVAVAFDVSAQTATIYYNGVQVAQGTVDAAATDSAASLIIGASGAATPNDKYFYGYMRNVRLWNVPRTAVELLANKNKSIQAGTTGLILQKFAWTDKAVASEAWTAKADHPFFDGIDDSVNLGDVFDQVGSFTIEAEVYPFTLTGINNVAMRFIWKVQNPTLGFYLGMGSATLDGRLRSQTRNATDKGEMTVTGVMVANIWQHVAYTFELGTLTGRLFYNGVEKLAQVLLGANLNNTADLFIGSGKSNLSYFNGRMRNVRLWNVQRTATEILANMNKSVPASSIGLDLQRFAWTPLAAASSSWSAV